MFKVIDGGPGTSPGRPTDPAGWKAQAAALRKIGRYRRSLGIEQSKNNVHSYGPRSMIAGYAAFVVCALCLVAQTYFQSFLSQFEMTKGLLFLLLPFVIAACTFVGVLIARKSTPMTWERQIDSLLAVYTPIDHEAYQNLQKRARDRGRLDWMDLTEWLEIEDQAIAVAAGWHVMPDNSFVNRRL